MARNHNQANDLFVLHQAKFLQATAHALTDTISQLRQSWPGSGTPAALTRLGQQLDAYTDTLGWFMPAVAPLTRPAGQPGWFGEVDLHTLPAPAAVAALTRLEAQVWQLNAGALNRQAEKVGYGCDLCFERIGAFAVPVSNSVVPGGQYEARLMLSHTSTGVKQQMLANGREISIGLTQSARWVG